MVGVCLRVVNLTHHPTSAVVKQMVYGGAVMLSDDSEAFFYDDSAF
jgi:hypothetical protein